MKVGISVIDIKIPEMAKAVVALATTAFGPSTGLGTITSLLEMPEAGTSPLCLGAFAPGGQLVGFLGCTPHRFRFQNEPVLLYQPAWAVTDKAWRGQGIFANLIREANQRLAARGAGGMFAAPNPYSGPVFTEVLGFQHLGSLQVGVLWNGLGFRKTLPPAQPQAMLVPIAEDLLAWQRRRHGSQLQVVEDAHGNVAWGRFRELQKWGLPLKYWLVGGFQVNHPDSFAKLMRKSGAGLQVCFFTPGSAYRRYFRWVRASGSSYLVWKSYQNGLPERPGFHAPMGAFDHF